MRFEGLLQLPILGSPKVNLALGLPLSFTLTLSPIPSQPCLKDGDETAGERKLLCTNWMAERSKGPGPSPLSP